jgi:3-dehydroquinate synthase
MRMIEIPVELGDRAYPVRIAAGLLDEAGRHLAPFVRNGRVVIVSDAQVWAAQGARLVAGLDPLAIVQVIVQVGEGAKSWTVLADLVDRLLSLQLERGEPILAFGGGVVGDLAGFAAAIVKRGCPWVQVPTSLLAQVDSSVGGKTGINTAGGKNMVGAFHHPSLVLIDPDCLATLDARQMRAGYAEIVKYALVEDAAFFEWLETNGDALLARDPPALRRGLATSVAGKARIVAQDERETNGRRALLNLGHTFAHALEAEAGYSTRLLHGEAVAVGLVLACRLSERLGHCSRPEVARVRDHLRAVGLPVGLDQIGSPAPDRLLGRMRGDKKAVGGRLPFILMRGLGAAFVAADVDPALVTEVLRSSE